MTKESQENMTIISETYFAFDIPFSYAFWNSLLTWKRSKQIKITAYSLDYISQYGI